MLKVTKNKIMINRGDVGTISVTAQNEDGSAYIFKAGDVIRFRIMKNGDYSAVLKHKDVNVEIETTEVDIVLTPEDTKIGDLINNPVNYSYEIELNPDHYGNYADVMLHVYRKKLYDNDRVEKMISLAEHAEKCCTDDDKRNEIYRIMLQLCSESKDPAIREKGKYYYKKLPSLRHSREVYAKFVMDGEEYRAQVLKNIIYTIDLAECSVRQLILPDMPPQEKLFYYQKAAALLETVLDGKYAGFYDPPLMSDYAEIAKIYVQLGQTDMAEEYINRIIATLEKHMIESEKENKSKILYSTTLRNAVPTEQICQKFLQNMVNIPEFEQFNDVTIPLLNKWEKHFIFDGETPK